MGEGVGDGCTWPSSSTCASERTCTTHGCRSTGAAHHRPPSHRTFPCQRLCVAAVQPGARALHRSVAVRENSNPRLAVLRAEEPCGCAVCEPPADGTFLAPPIRCQPTGTCSFDGSRFSATYRVTPGEGSADTGVATDGVMRSVMPSFLTAAPAAAPCHCPPSRSAKASHLAPISLPAPAQGPRLRATSPEDNAMPWP